MMMKYWLIILVLCGAFINAQAQKDPKAKVVLDKVANATKSFSSMDIAFSFALTNEEEGLNDEYEGKVQVKGLKYKLSMMGAETYFDGKAIYTYLPDAGEVNIDNPSESMEQMLNPSKLFTIYEEGFDYKWLKKEGANTIVELIPTTDERNFKKVILTINEAKKQLVGAKLFSKDGNTYIITVKSFTSNKAYDDTYFTFDTKKHADVYVNDMR
ncbi:outer membrane lipoprotein carrier protein LolA [Prolixibacteraceae bacterium JC049]|nr:outer membrane lipoprotein carrier protein LolA [Prolixibacteraceae bacterium JC049]